MIEIGKTYKVKQKYINFVNAKAIELHQVGGEILKEDREDFLFDFLSDEIYATIVSESPVDDNVYLAIMASDIGITCCYIDKYDLGREV